MYIHTYMFVYIYIYIQANTHTHTRTYTPKHILNDTYARVHTGTQGYMSHEPCHTYGWVTSHIWMSHVTHMDESRHTYG